MHKYLFKVFYKKTNKKKYKLQILEYNIHHTNVIAMQDAILIAKIPVRSDKKKELIVNMPDIEVTQICNTTNILLKYNWYLDFIDNKAAIDLGLQSIKKYHRRLAQVADELSHLPNFLPALTIFVNKAYGNYDQKI